MITKHTLKKYRASIVLMLFALTSPGLARAETTKLENPLRGLGINSVAELITKLFQWAIMLAGIAAAASIIVAGYELMWKSGTKDAHTSAVNRLKWSVAGLAVIILSYTIVSLVIGTLSGRTTSRGGNTTIPPVTTQPTPTPTQPTPTPTPTPGPSDPGDGCGQTPYIGPTC